MNKDRTIRVRVTELEYQELVRTAKGSVSDEVRSRLFKGFNPKESKDKPKGLFRRDKSDKKYSEVQRLRPNAKDGNKRVNLSDYGI